MRTRSIVGLAATAVVALLSACASAPGGPSGPSGPVVAPATPSATTIAAATPASTPGLTGPFVLSTAGIGPYHIGDRTDDLHAAGLLGTSTAINPAECPDLYSVAATGIYAGTLLLTIRHSVLVEIGTAGGETVTSPDGARVGMSFAEVQAIYGADGTLYPGTGPDQGLLVTEGDRVLLFTGHPIRQGVGYFSAGLADYTAHVFLDDAPC